jgi:predicted nucleotidyltransferase
VNYGLNEKLLIQIKHVFSNYPEIEKVILYGSRAKGNFKPGSDIDLTLITSHKNFQKLNQLKNDLDDLNSPYTFDVSLNSDIDNQNLLDHINRVGIIFYLKS